jgi:hypothetical protein
MFKLYKLSLTINKISLAYFIGLFTIADLLIFPYFQLIIFPVSLPLIIASFFLFQIPFKKDKYTYLFFLITVCCVLSLLVSLVIPGLNPFFIDNLKRAIQFWTSFLYFFYFRWLVGYTFININPIIFFFSIWFLAFLLFFYFDPLGFNAFVSKYYGRVVQSQDDLESHFRFSYIFSDPNTASYFFLVATAPILLTIDSIKLKFIILIGITIILFLAQSRGAIISLFFVMLFMFFPSGQFIKSIFNIKRILFISVTVILFYFLYLYLDSLANDDILFKNAFERIFKSDDTSKGGFRFEIWESFFDNFIPLPFGRGYNLIINGIPSPPHSDFLRLIYAYGFVAFFSVFFFLFSKFKIIEPLIIPALIAFSINTMIDEQKFFALFLSYLAIFSSSNETYKIKKNNS